MSFYQKLATVYEYVFPIGIKPDFLAGHFSHASTLLDVGCSDGRVAKAMTEKGFNVHAIDLSPEMIQIAKSVAKEVESLNVKSMNMLDLTSHYKENAFEGVYCIGNTLVHLKDKLQIADALLEFSKVLVPGGKLVVQILNYERVFSERIESLPLIENDFVKFERQYALDPPQVLFKTKLAIKKANELHEAETTLYGLTKTDLGNLLVEAGFAGIEWYGNFKGDSLTESSLQLIAVCTKK